MRIVLVLILCFANNVTWAQEQGEPPAKSGLSYNFVELRYVDTDNNGGDGFELNGSFNVSGYWLAIGGITRIDFDGDVDATTIELGVGYFWPWRQGWDIVGNARIIRSDVDFPTGKADDTGIGLTGGLRGLLVDRFEVRGFAHYVNLDDSDIFLEIAGDYYFTGNIAAGLSIEFAGDADAITLGARWYFR